MSQIDRDRILNTIFENPGLLGSIENGLSFIKDGLLVEFLKANLPAVDFRDITEAALSSAKWNGYLQCIDDLVNFKEKYIMPLQKTKTQNKILANPTFGARASIKENNYMTPKEQEEIYGNK